MGGRSRSQQKDKRPQKVIAVSLQQDVKLHTTENAWKPAAKADKEAPSEEPDGNSTAVRIRVLIVSGEEETNQSEKCGHSRR